MRFLQRVRANRRRQWLRPLGALLAAVPVAVLLAGCATAPRVDVDSDPQADFGRYATFGFHEPLGTDRPDATATLLSQTLKQAARTELEAAGYRYVEHGGDLEINFFVETREVVEDSPRAGVGVGVGYGGFHSRYRVWADYPVGRIHQFTEGALHVDVIDRRRRQLVWEGIARDRLTDGAFEREEARQAVVEVFRRFPRAVPREDPQASPAQRSE
jgi:hypothetical protein